MGCLSNITGLGIKGELWENYSFVWNNSDFYSKGHATRKASTRRGVVQRLSDCVRHSSGLKPSILVPSEDHNRQAPKDPFSSFARGISLPLQYLRLHIQDDSHCSHVKFAWAMLEFAMMKLDFSTRTIHTIVLIAKLGPTECNGGQGVGTTAIGWLQAKARESEPCSRKSRKAECKIC